MDNLLFYYTNYQCFITLNNNIRVYSLLYIQEKNLLMSAGIEYIIFWNLTNIIF